MILFLFCLDFLNAEKERRSKILACKTDLMKKAKSIYFINIVFQCFYLSNPWPLYYDTTSSYSLLHLSLHFQISYPCPDSIFSSSFYSTIPVLTFWNLFPYINSKLSSYYLIPILTF